MRPFLLIIGATLALGAGACSCFGPSTFCGTLDPPYPEPQWWVPDEVVMAVVVGEEAYGVDVRIVRVFAGALQQDQIIRVWGDCGALCRRYVTGIPQGDTVVWALQHTDLSGNTICGSQLESAGEYQLSVCGVYALSYANGHVSGPITSEVDESMDLDALEQLVHGCLSTGIPVRTTDPLTVRYGPEGTSLMLTSTTDAELILYAATGMAVLHRRWDGTPITLQDLPPGIYLLSVVQDGQRWTRKLYIP